MLCSCGGGAYHVVQRVSRALAFVWPVEQAEARTSLVQSTFKSICHLWAFGRAQTPTWKGAGQGW